MIRHGRQNVLDTVQRIAKQSLQHGMMHLAVIEIGTCCAFGFVEWKICSMGAEGTFRHLRSDSGLA